MTSSIETIELPKLERGNINIGNKVKSFDFEGIESCYVEGEVAGYAHIEQISGAFSHALAAS